MTESLTLTAGDLYPVVRVTLTDDTGAPVDLTDAQSATFTLRRVGAAEPAFTAAAAIASPATDGVLEYAWTAGDTEVPGDYDAAFRALYTLGGVSYPSVGRLRVRIQPSLTTVADEVTWAYITPADAATLLGRDVAEADLYAAQGMIAVLADVDALTALSIRDTGLLAAAAAYQALWVADNPDLLAAADVDSVSQDGASAHFGHADARLLAPMARRCLDRLSWRQTLSSPLIGSDRLPVVVEEE